MNRTEKKNCKTVKILFVYVFALVNTLIVQYSFVIIYIVLNNCFRASCAHILGAEPSPAYFNIMMYNNREAILDGTQLAADWTFSGLQKFGQGLLDKLRGLKLPHPLLEKVIDIFLTPVYHIIQIVERNPFGTLLTSSCVIAVFFTTPRSR